VANQRAGRADVVTDFHPHCSGASCISQRQILKLVFHLIDARVETTWVPGAFQVWVRGSQRAPPHRTVALQVEFER
jgi:hypothetical protein